jgi:hypothetical protein
MNFKEATDALFERVTHDDLADELSVSVPAIRQARLAQRANAYRTPPPGWEKAVGALAKKRIRKLEDLIRALRVGNEAAASRPR